ncbi:hypothetical protein K438DRAFT_1954152 [Mycena galopus ATCC 62051]|nr:hypothetical protein K438DRAFT_1954152 [Mycena galopus ATCC 62051]
MVTVSSSSLAARARPALRAACSCCTRPAFISALATIGSHKCGTPLVPSLPSPSTSSPPPPSLEAYPPARTRPESELLLDFVPLLNRAPLPLPAVSSLRSR